MRVVWLRQRGSRIAHAFTDEEFPVGVDAFRDDELRQDRAGEGERVEPVAHCGRYLVAALERDELAERCRACASTVTKVEAMEGSR